MPPTSGRASLYALSSGPICRVDSAKLATGTTHKLRAGLTPSGSRQSTGRHRSSPRAASKCPLATARTRSISSTRFPPKAALWGTRRSLACPQIFACVSRLMASRQKTSWFQATAAHSGSTAKSSVRRLLCGVKPRIRSRRPIPSCLATRRPRWLSCWQFLMPRFSP